MPIELDLSSAPMAVRVRLSDAWPTTEEQTAVQLRLLSEGHLLADTRVLVDIRDVKPPHYQETTRVMETTVAVRAWPRRCAFLVGSAVQYGFSRQLEALAPPGGTVDIFANEAEAQKWLHPS